MCACIKSLLRRYACRHIVHGETARKIVDAVGTRYFDITTMSLWNVVRLSTKHQAVYLCGPDQRGYLLFLCYSESEGYALLPPGTIPGVDVDVYAALAMFVK